MTMHTGRGVRRLAARILPDSTVQRFVDPAIADLQHEHASALHYGHPWRARRVRLFGTLRLLQVIALLGVLRALQIGMGHRAIRPALATVAAVMAVAAISIGLVFFMLVQLPLEPWRPGDNVRLVYYLVPSTVVVSIPLGCALGAIMAVGRRVGLRQRLTLLVTAAALSALSFGLFAVLVPTANREWVRTLVGGHPAAPGIHEMPFTDLRVWLAPEPYRLVRGHFIIPHNDARAVFFAYETRFAISLAPLVFCILAFSLSNRRRALRTCAVVCVWAGYLLWYAWFDEAVVSASAVPVSLLAWMPNILVLTSAMLLSTTGLRRLA
jgi:hypothetical protein